MHFAAIKTWTLTYSNIKHTSKNVRKKGCCCLKLAAFPWWWMQMVCGPQRIGVVQGTETPLQLCLVWPHKPAPLLSGKRKRKNGRSPVKVICPSIHVPSNIFNCLCCVFLAALCISCFPNLRGGHRTNRHTHISSLLCQFTEIRDP